MKKINLFLLAIALITLNSCEVIGDIFQAGAAFGVIMVVLVVGFVIWLVSKMGGGRS
jgi:hypothetical protein